MSIDINQFLTSPAQATEGFDGICYGPSGVGKTSTLDDDNLRVLHLDMEGGSSVLQGAPNVKRFDIPMIASQLTQQYGQVVTRYEVFEQIAGKIDRGEYNGHFDLLAEDSLTAFEEIVKEYVALKYAPNRKREITGKFGAKADWGDLADLIAKNVRMFHGFTKRGINSFHNMWLAHVRDEKDELTQQIITTKVNLQGRQTPDVVMSIVDGYFYMGNQSIPQEGGEPLIQRYIFTKPWGPYAAKARQSKRQDALPAYIVAPVWSQIFTQLGYVRK